MKLLPLHTFSGVSLYCVKRAAKLGRNIVEVSSTTVVLVSRTANANGLNIRSPGGHNESLGRDVTSFARHDDLDSSLKEKQCGKS